MIPNFLDTDDFKKLQEIVNQLVDISNTVGDVTTLSTTQKNQIVAAINEIVAELGTLPAEFEAKFTDFLNSIVALGDNVPADRILYTSAVDTVALQAISSYVRGLLNSADRAAFMNNINISTYFQNALNLSDLAARDALNVQTRNTNLTQISNVAPINLDSLIHNGSQYVSEAILDYHQPTIVAPATNTVYPFIEFLIAPQTWFKILARTDQGTAQINFRRNGVIQLANPLLAEANTTQSSFTPINFSAGDRVELFVGATSGGVGRVQICIPHKKPRFSQII